MYLVSFDTAYEFEAVQGRLKEGKIYFHEKNGFHRFLFIEIKYYCLLDFSSHISFWTSGFRPKESSAWFWQSTKRLFNSKFVYWSGNQPEVPADKDACVYISEPNYLWYDKSMAECHRRYNFNFICEALDDSF
jgi:hypothetical protein